PHGRVAGHGPHVHREALYRWRRHDEALLHAPLHRGSDRPAAGDALTSVRVSRKGADRIASGHPWVFSSDVTGRAGAEPGAVVEVIDHKGRSVGIAHYSASSQICLRLLGSRPEEVGPQFFARGLAAAAEYRRAIVRDTDAYRLVHAEADLLPALVVD